VAEVLCQKQNTFKALGEKGFGEKSVKKFRDGMFENEIDTRPLSPASIAPVQGNVVNLRENYVNVILSGVST